MAGTAKRMIDKLIAEKSKGDKYIESTISVKLILKGIMVNKITSSTPDDPSIIAKIREAGKEYGIML